MKIQITLSFSRKAIDDNTAKLCMDYRGIHVEYDVYFDEDGRILSLKTKRYKENELLDWTGEFSDYHQVKGMKVPRKIQAN